MSPITDTMLMHEVCKALGGLHPDTVRTLVKSGEFPEALEVTAQGRVWLRSDVEWFLYGKTVKSRLAKKPDGTGRNRGEAGGKLEADPD